MPTRVSVVRLFALLAAPLALAWSWAEASAGPSPGAGGLTLEGHAPAEDGTYLHVFGQAAQEQELEATLRLVNGGDAPLTGLRAVGDCGCYGVLLEKDALAPGEGGEVTVKFRTLMMSGRVTKRLRLFHEGGPPEGLTIRLQVEIVAGVVLDPGRLWFGDVLLGSTPRGTVVAKWHKQAGRPFRVTSVEVPGHAFEVARSPYEEGDWKGTAITLAFERPPPLGVFSATAQLWTDHPDYPRITLALTANVTGRVWVQSRTVYFGWVEQGTTREASVLVRPFDAAVPLGNVSAQSRGGHVEVQVEPAPGRPPGEWRVVLRVPEDAAPGPLDDVVEVHSQVPGEETTEIEVRGEVLPRGR